MKSAKNKSIENIVKVHISLAKGLLFGLLGGFVSTMLMDLIMMAAIAALGESPYLCFTIVGNTVMKLVSISGAGNIEVILIGIAAHYIIGPIAGAIFGLAIVKVLSAYPLTNRDILVLSVVYIEIISQPILATSPFLLNWTNTQTLTWYGGAFVMHFILGLVLGLVVTCGLFVTGRSNIQKDNNRIDLKNQSSWILSAPARHR